MVLVTLIGESQAKIGNRFYYLGPSLECRECRFKNVCFNLEVGRMYEVTELRDVNHECEMHESGVRAVVVVKVPMRVCVERKYAIDGSRITFEHAKCSEVGCTNWGLCHPFFVKDGDKLSIVEILENTECSAGEKRTIVRTE